MPWSGPSALFLYIAVAHEAVSIPPLWFLTECPTKQHADEMKNSKIYLPLPSPILSPQAYQMPHLRPIHISRSKEHKDPASPHGKKTGTDGPIRVVHWRNRVRRRADANQFENATEAVGR